MTSLFDGTPEQLRPLLPGVVNNFTVKKALTNLLDDVAEQLLPRFLGLNLSQLLTNDPDADDEVLGKAVKLARSVVAKLGFAEYLPFAEVQIGDDGITVTALENRRAAFDYQTQKLDRSLRESAWQKLDELLTLVAANPNIFPDWDQTPYQAELGESIFKTAADFSKYYPIQNRWLTFWALRSSISTVEDNQGQTYLARIDALPPSVTDGQKAPLLRNLKRCLAHEAVILALPKLSVEISGANLQINYGAQYGGSASYYTAPAKEQIDWLSQLLQKQTDVLWLTVEGQLAALTPTTEAEADDAFGLIDYDGPFVMI